MAATKEIRLITYRFGLEQSLKVCVHAMREAKNALLECIHEQGDDVVSPIQYAWYGNAFVNVGITAITKVRGDV